MKTERNRRKTEWNWNGARTPFRENARTVERSFDERKLFIDGYCTCTCSWLSKLAPKYLNTSEDVIFWRGMPPDPIVTRASSNHGLLFPPPKPKILYDTLHYKSPYQFHPLPVLWYHIVAVFFVCLNMYNVDTPWAPSADTVNSAGRKSTAHARSRPGKQIHWSRSQASSLTSRHAAHGSSLTKQIARNHVVNTWITGRLFKLMSRSKYAHMAVG